MTEKKYKNFLNVLLIIIIIAIVGIAGYIAYEYIYLRKTIDANASDILDAFDKYMNEKDKTREIAVSNENDNGNEINKQTNTNLRNNSERNIKLCKFSYWICINI